MYLMSSPALPSCLVQALGFAGDLQHSQGRLGVGGSGVGRGWDRVRLG